MQKYRAGSNNGRIGELGETRVGRFRSPRERETERRANSNLLAKPVPRARLEWRASITFLAPSQMCALHYPRVECERKNACWEEYKQAQVVPRNP